MVPSQAPSPQVQPWPSLAVPLHFLPMFLQGRLYIELCSDSGRLHSAWEDLRMEGK